VVAVDGEPLPVGRDGDGAVLVLHRDVGTVLLAAGGEQQRRYGEQKNDRSAHVRNPLRFAKKTVARGRAAVQAPSDRATSRTPDSRSASLRAAHNRARCPHEKSRASQAAAATVRCRRECAPTGAPTPAVRTHDSQPPPSPPAR